jgi:hypothetical protein
VTRRVHATAWRLKVTRVVLVWHSFNESQRSFGSTLTAGALGPFAIYRSWHKSEDEGLEFALVH